MIVDILRVYRNLQNRIYGYDILIHDKNETTYIEANKLKELVKSKNININGYKLTKNNRLILLNNHYSNPNNIYYLMNKDNIVGSFDIDTRNLNIHGKMPIGFTNITDWINKRAKFSCANNVEEFFKYIGINSTSDFIEITHCVSLHDSFWVKRKNDNKKWANVSPFRNNYSKVISTYALDGSYIGKNDKNYFSPDISTGGSFPHTWKHINGKIKFIKAGTKYTLGGINSGREPYSEYFASQLCKFLDFNCVEYTIRKHIRQDGRIDIVTECDCFNTEDTGSVTAYNLGLNSYEKVIEYSKSISKNAYNTILDMLFLDCLLLNTDRHFSNIEFLVDNQSLNIINIAPIFDNNNSLLPRFMEEYETFNRSDYIARDNRTFEEIFSLVSNHKNYRNTLIKLKSFKFTKPYSVDIPDSRLRFLNQLLKMQIQHLLRYC